MSYSRAGRRPSRVQRSRGALLTSPSSRSSMRHPSVLVPRRTVFVESMGITAAQRRKAIGRTLVEAAMAEGRARGTTGSEPTVWEFDHAALAFYERVGL